jgi:hypothetical protein
MHTGILQVTEGDIVVLPCRAGDTRPPPSIVWFKDDKRIDIAADSRHALYPDTGSLEIQMVSRDDAGAYKCIASVPGTDKTRTSSTGTLKVVAIDRDNALDAEPSFVRVPRSQVVRNGGRAVLECAANARPRPVLVWLRDRTTIDVNTDTRLKLVGVSTLVIDGVRASDSGTYTCRASNDDDSKDAQATLDVIGMVSLMGEMKFV